MPILETLGKYLKGQLTYFDTGGCGLDFEGVTYGHWHETGAYLYVT